MRLLRTGLLIALLAALLAACAVKDAGERAGTTAQNSNEAPSGSTTEPKTESESETSNATEAAVPVAVYLGVENYGMDDVDKDHIDDFRYRFDFDGVERVYQIDNSAKSADGSPSYPIQNVLKEGSRYALTVSDGFVTAASEIAPADAPEYDLPICAVPGERSIANFLRTALMPVGRTLYVYGGGWNWQDDGSSVQATSIGVCDDWIRFFDSNDGTYSYGSESNPSKYFPYGGFNEYYYAGLDCSGYLGWAIYNTLETASGSVGWVGPSTSFAKRLADGGLGIWIKPDGAPALTPGDVVSIKGHVWIALGTCSDGSAVIAHSTPSTSRAGFEGGGVQISAIGDGSSEAYALASSYMTRYYPEWFARYEAVAKPASVYYDFSADAAGVFSWSPDVLSDDEGFRQMSAAEVLAALYGE